MLATHEQIWPISVDLLRHYLLDRKLTKTEIGRRHGRHARSVDRLVKKYSIDGSGTRLTRQPINLGGIPNPFRPAAIPKPRQPSRAVVAVSDPEDETPPCMPAEATSPAPLLALPPPQSEAIQKSNGSAVAAPVAPRKPPRYRLSEWTPEKPPFEITDVKPDGHLLTEQEIANIYGDFVYPELCLVDRQGKHHPMSMIGKTGKRRF